MEKTITNSSLLGISQDYMAMLLKISRAQWSMYELGKRDIPLEAKRLLAEMIGFLKMGETEVKTLPHLDHQQEATKEQLEKSLTENHYQLYEINREIAKAQERYNRNNKAVQLCAYLSSRAETQALFDGELLKNISDRAITALQKSGLSELTSLKMNEELLQLKKLLLGSALRKFTVNLEPAKV